MSFIISDPIGLVKNTEPSPQIFDQLYGVTSKSFSNLLGTWIDVFTNALRVPLNNEAPVNV